jgi:tetratricopeptide (TPR) repeat protein
MPEDDSFTPEPIASPPARGIPWRAILLVVLLLILIYPVVRRLIPAGSPPAAPSAKAAIDSSFKAYSAGRYQEAIEFGKTALRLDPNSAEAYNNIAASYAGLKNWDLAIQNIGQALRLKPDFQLAKNNLMWYVQQKGGAPAAGSPADYYVNLSLQLYQAGKYQECIDAAREGVKRDPNSARAYSNMAAAYSGLKMWDQAIDAAQQAVRIDPGFELARNNLAWAITQKRK